MHVKTRAGRTKSMNSMVTGHENASRTYEIYEHRHAKGRAECKGKDCEIQLQPGSCCGPSFALADAAISRQYPALEGKGREGIPIPSSPKAEGKGERGDSDPLLPKREGERGERG